MLRMPIVVSLAIPLLVGCERAGAPEPEPPAEDAVFHFDTAGVARLTLVEDLRLDAERENLSVVRALAVGSDGRIAVPLRQDGQVWVYDSMGTRIGTFGRKGEGPGEFVVVGTVGFVGDTLWVDDIELPRITWFHPDGTLLRTWTPQAIRLGSADSTVAPELPATFLFPEVVRRDGSILGAGRYWTAEPWRSSLSEEVIVHVSSGGDARVISTPTSDDDPRWIIEVGGLETELPFTQRPLHTWSPDGRFFADLSTQATSQTGGTVTLTLVSETGDTLVSRVYPFVGTPVSGSERDSAIAELAPAGVQLEGPPDLYQRRQEIARERMPAVHAPLTGFRVGLDGTIWIDLRATLDGNVTLVLDERGIPIGSVILPDGVTIRAASRDRVWGIHRDALGLTSVVRYRVEGLR